MAEVLVVWTAPRLLAGRLAEGVSRSLVWVLAAELAGAGVFLAYGAAAERNAAVASLLYGQYALVAAAIGFVVFRERLARPQLAGAALAVAGTLVIAAGRV